ncbi:MAG TPA: helix-turn-helix domain-containing protein, partial [Pseudonocardiaceae bacterium]
GISESYLSRIERGERSVDRRRLLEALAAALRVAPSEITGQPYPPSSEAEAEAHAAAQSLRAVLRDIEIGAAPIETPRSVDELRSVVRAVNAACDACDYVALGETVPGLIAELHALVEQGDSREALRLLAEVLHAAFYLSKDLGHGDLAWMVSGHLQNTAAATGDPVWGAVAGFVRSHATVGLEARERGLMLAEQSARLLQPDTGDAGQAYGMLHSRQRCSPRSPATGQAPVTTSPRPPRPRTAPVTAPSRA